MLMLQQSAVTLPLFIGDPGESPPPLCGAMPAGADYIAKPNDKVIFLRSLTFTLAFAHVPRVFDTTITGSDGLLNAICHFLTHPTLKPKPLIAET